MVKQNIKRNISEHPILVVELILLLIAIPLIVWIGLSETDKYEDIQIFLVFLDALAIVVCPIIMLCLDCRVSREIRELEKKRKWENSKKYRKQFVSNFCVENAYLGKCIFEKDINKNRVVLVDGIKQIKFGTYNVSVNINISDKNISLVLEKIEDVYKNAKEILNQTYEAAIEPCKVWAGAENDKMINIINFDYVKNNYKLSMIDVFENKSGNIFINLLGDVTNEKGESQFCDHSFVTEIDCKTGKISYDLIG